MVMSKPYRTLICDSIDKIGSLTSLSQLSGTFTYAMAELGFSSMGINGLPRPREGADPVILAESTPSGFRDFYIEENFYVIDHICAHARIVSAPFRYDEAPYSPSHSELHKRFLDALQSYQMGRGLIVPFGYPFGMPACVWLAGKNPELHNDAIVATQSISLFAASKAHALFAPPNAAAIKPLATREREVLQWICEGKTAAEISDILGITKRTVDAHAQSATRKLNAANRTQAVAVALSQRIISL
jgi:LuxR family transcriptional regulator, quorum-sensing system regulator BjaR1